MSFDGSTQGAPASCASCAFFLIVEGTGGLCRFNPPTAIALVSPPALAGGRPQVQMVAQSPPVSADYWCGQFCSPDDLAAWRLARVGVITGDLTPDEGDEDASN